MLKHDTPWADGTPCWVDLMVPDRKKAVAFYRGLFGWDITEGSEETGFYAMAMVAERSVAGIGEISAEQQGMPAAWTTYISVSDVDKTVAAISEAGGQIMMPVLDVMEEGRMAIAADPTGAVFGLWQPGRHYGVQVTGAPGTLAWNESMTRDFEAAKAFYGEVFGYHFNDMSADGFQYATFVVNGRDVGGLGQLPADVPADVPAHWGVYFSVADADAAAAKIAELGGTVTNPPFDSPHGRIAVAMDNQGAMFRVIAPNEQSGKPEGWEE